MPVIPTQEDEAYDHEFKASLAFILRPYLKQNKKRKSETVYIFYINY
jgi:hypothetical protein